MNRINIARAIVAVLLWLGAHQDAAAQGIVLRYAQAYSAMRTIFALPLLVAQREDFQARFVDGTPARLDCLTTGDCAAVPLGQPHDLVAMRRGYRLLGFSTDAVPEYLYTVTAARRSWAEANKDTLVRYVRALA